MKAVDVLNVLGDDFSNIYCVNRNDESIEIYRYENSDVGVKDVMNTKSPYRTAIQNYIEKAVVTEDREKMKLATELENICKKLKTVSHFTLHYRIKRNGEVLFYRMKCARIGNADTFQKIVFAFASEDADVRMNELGTVTKFRVVTGKRKILIVEDDRLNQEILISLLDDKYEILTADNGKKGLEILEKHYKELSVILLDIQMPVLNGYEFLKRVKDDLFLSSVPIIVMTASNEGAVELECLDLGAADYIRKPYNAELIKKRIRNVIRLKESSLTLKAVELDELTGVYTEQAFCHYAKQSIQFNPNVKMHIVVGKIKDFRLINSIYGRKKADELLCYLASAFRRQLTDGMVARKGSSSFVCLMYGESNLEAQKIEHTIREIIQKAPIIGVKVKYGIYENIDKNIPITTICDYAYITAETVMENYDCDYAYYTEEIANKKIYTQMIENSFADALYNKEFVVFYQPKVDIVTEKVIGAEALIRWSKPDGSIISPGDFIPVFEGDGLIRKLDRYVFKQVCQLQKRVINDQKKLLPISVNISRASILFAGVADQYIKIARENEVPISCVSLEITESAAIYIKKIRKTAEKLIEEGFELHVDDFGAGYSSLVSLSELSFSVLKIDKGLIDHICEDKGRILVRQVIKLAKVLNMKVIAEGVETKEQLEELKKMQCDAIQGFYYARPMPEDEFIEYARKNR